MQIISKRFSLDDNYSVLMERDENEKRVFLVDNILHDYRKLATYIDGKWSFSSVANENEFFKITKQFPSIITNNIHKPMLLTWEVTMEKQFDCFRRRWKVTLFRSFNKLKHVV